MVLVVSGNLNSDLVDADADGGHHRRANPFHNIVRCNKLHEHEIYCSRNVANGSRGVKPQSCCCQNGSMIPDFVGRDKEMFSRPNFFPGS